MDNLWKISRSKRDKEEEGGSVFQIDEDDGRKGEEGGFQAQRDTEDNPRVWCKEKEKGLQK